MESAYTTTMVRLRSLRAFFCVRFALCIFCAFALISPSHLSAQARKGKQAKAPVAKSASSEDTLPKAVKYYRLVGLGSSEGDTTNTFPYPTAILQVLDTVHTRIVVRFPELGMLGIKTDTVTAPTFTVGDTLQAFEAPDALYMLTFPKTTYFLFIDVFTKNSQKLLDSRPLEFDMNVDAYRNVKLTYVHDPTAGMGSPTLRRLFKPSLLPFSIETNPGWASTETLDSSMTYALVFRDPNQPNKLEMSITMRPAFVGVVDSSMWQNFKSKAEVAFGTKGIATHSIGDFQVEDTATRRYIKGGHEFVARNADSTLDYVAAFLTPRAILLMLAPMDEPNQQLEFEYFQAIARSFKLE